MDLTLSPISSPSGTRDCVVDFTNVLEDDETVTGVPTAVSSDETILTVANVGINDAEIIKDGGGVIAAGKGVIFSIATILAAKTNITITVHFEGDAGTAETYIVVVPVRTPALTA